MLGKLDQQTGKVKIELGGRRFPRSMGYASRDRWEMRGFVIVDSDIARLTSAKARNTLPIRRCAFAPAPNDISLMHQLRFSNLFIRLITALAKGGGQPAHA